MEILTDFFRFLQASKTVFHAADETVKRLLNAGFIRLHEGEKWHLNPGKGYFIFKGDSLVAAFRVPKQKPNKAVLLASHIDSPSIKLKPSPNHQNQEIGTISTEVYGAPLLHTWFDRNLVLAGKVNFLQDSLIQSQLVSFETTPLIIPGLAIHLDRSISEKGFLVNKQDHLKAVFSLEAKSLQIETVLKEKYPQKKILSFDLFLSPSEEPSFIGFKKELIASARLDNLTSAYAALHAITKASPQDKVLQMALFWDHEEIGSMSQTGADSLFANEILERICLALKIDREDYFRLKSTSFCLSGDLAHGFHPNYAEKFDLSNAPFLGKGVILKFNANQKYATDSSIAAYLLYLAEKNGIAVQKFAGRSDIPSGSTVGPIMAAKMNLHTADVGIASWSMHSTRETISSADQISLCEFFLAALQEDLTL